MTEERIAQIELENNKGQYTWSHTNELIVEVRRLRADADNVVPVMRELNAEIVRLRAGLESLKDPFCLRYGHGKKAADCSCVMCKTNRTIDAILKG